MSADGPEPASPEPAPPVLTVEQAAACIASVYDEAPYVMAIRLKVGAEMRRDEGAVRFWDLVAESLSF